MVNICTATRVGKQRNLELIYSWQPKLISEYCEVLISVTASLLSACVFSGHLGTQLPSSRFVQRMNLSFDELIWTIMKILTL